MLVALLLAFVLGGGSNPYVDLVKQCQKATKSAVTEPDRREAVVAVLKEMTAAIGKFEKSRDKSAKALAKVGENYASTAAEYRAVFDARQADNVEFQDTMVILHRNLKSRVTAEEWAKIVAKTDMKPEGS